MKHTQIGYQARPHDSVHTMTPSPPCSPRATGREGLEQDIKKAIEQRQCHEGQDEEIRMALGVHSPSHAGARNLECGGVGNVGGRECSQY